MTGARDSKLPQRFGPFTATLVVAASMIGTGVFTTTGLLLGEMGSASAVLLAWTLGGVFALAGALAYGGLSAGISRNGGEYRFLTDIYHPAVGFVAGWLSLVVGFSAPTAASALAFGKYLHALVPALEPTPAALVLVLCLAGLHASRVSAGAWLQNVFAAAKILLILIFVVGAAWILPGIPPGRFVAPGSEIVSSRFAVALVFVAFAYSGWNGAAYLSGEMLNPRKNVPLALGLGTGIVTLLYVGLNAAFLVAADPRQIAGTVEVGHVAAVGIFGEGAGTILSSLIALALVSSVSAMIMVGPRVYEAMGEDYVMLRFLRLRPGGGGPVVSIALQTLLAVIMLLTLSFDVLLMYIGFTLSASAALTVVGLFLYRRQHPQCPRPVWGYPVTPAVFVLFASWMIVHSISQRPLEALLGVGTIGIGLVLYWVAKRKGTAVPGELDQDRPPSQAPTL